MGVPHPFPFTLVNSNNILCTYVKDIERRTYIKFFGLTRDIWVNYLSNNRLKIEQHRRAHEKDVSDGWEDTLWPEGTRGW